MQLERIDEIFDISYGNGFSLNQLKETANGINFISRTAKNNGVSGIVMPQEVEPFKNHTITVSLGGSVLESFYQSEPYYTGYHIYVLTPKNELSKAEMFFYCMCIRANKYKYNYGRQANRTLKDVLVPHPNEIPDYVKQTEIKDIEHLRESLKSTKVNYDMSNWEYFHVSDMFDVGLGKPVHKTSIRNYSEEYEDGYLLYITRTAKNNGVEFYVPRENYESDYIFKGNAITIGAEGFKAFYQEQDFITGNKVNILRNEYLNKYNSLFINAILNLEIEKKFGYGRGLVKSRITELKIKLPAIEESENVYIPDYKFMEKYIKSQSYSKNI